MQRAQRAQAQAQAHPRKKRIEIEYSQNIAPGHSHSWLRRLRWADLRGGEVFSFNGQRKKRDKNGKKEKAREPIDVPACIHAEITTKRKRTDRVHHRKKQRRGGKNAPQPPIAASNRHPTTIVNRRPLALTPGGRVQRSFVALTAGCVSGGLRGLRGECGCLDWRAGWGGVDGVVLIWIGREGRGMNRQMHEADRESEKLGVEEYPSIPDPTLFFLTPPNTHPASAYHNHNNRTERKTDVRRLGKAAIGGWDVLILMCGSALASGFGFGVGLDVFGDGFSRKKKRRRSGRLKVEGQRWEQMASWRRAEVVNERKRSNIHAASTTKLKARGSRICMYQYRTTTAASSMRCNALNGKGTCACPSVWYCALRGVGCAVCGVRIAEVWRAGEREVFEVKRVVEPS
ncbi:hypothetical protein B0H34DRAFT_676053 [Crassisporium funariophilum]|nr:hypothetical protein B0H34DRAFT_676053 [Crassisporium funariophilum]